MIALGVLLVAAWGAGELSHPALYASDLAVVQDLATHRSGPLSWVARALSLSGSILVIAPLVAVCCVALYRGGRGWASILLAVSTAGAAVIFNLEKLIVARARPPVEHLVAAPHSSFPSGHATLSAAFYGALLIVFVTRRPRPVAAMAVAVAAALLVGGIACSRVYLGVHYPTDVAGGMALGVAWTLIVARSLWRGRAPARSEAHAAGSGECASRTRAPDAIGTGPRPEPTPARPG